MKSVVLLLVAVTCLQLGIAFDNGFRADDFQFLAAVRSAPDPGALLGVQQDVAFYRPLALLLFAAEHALFGLHAGLYLVFNGLLHGLSAVLALLVFRRLELDRRAAVLATGLFLVGVFHLDKQVLWACTSGGLLAVNLILLALWLDAGPAPPRRRAPVLVLALITPFAHEVGLLLPLLVLLRRGLAPGADDRPRWFDSVLLLGLGFLPWLAGTLLLDSAGPAATAGAALGPGAAFGTLLRYVAYFGLALLPVPAASSAVPAAFAPWLLGTQVLLGLAVILGCVVLLGRRRAPWGLRFLAGWLLLAVLPYAAIPLPDGWLELRYLYFAALPLAGLVATWLRQLASTRGARRTLALALGTGLVTLTLALSLVLEHRSDREARNPENRARREALIAPSERDG